MAGLEAQDEVQLSNSPLDEHGFGDLLQGDSDYTGSLQNEEQGEANPLLLLADVALAPVCGECVQCSCLDSRGLEKSLEFIQLQFNFLMSKANKLQDRLVSSHTDREALAAAVRSFLYTCQPYFNHLESTARSTMVKDTNLPSASRTMLLDFSQQLCDRLEQMVLTFANYDLLCLDEADPDSVSHFCIGQCHFNQLRVTIFRYCKPTQYMARDNTVLYKRMRWNVERIQVDGEQAGEADTEYYFLCYEDIPNELTDVNEDCQGVSPVNPVRMWSIGRWVQVDPDTEDICDWITCEVPLATYHKLLILGSDEPSCCNATDYLQQLLMSHDYRLI
ncbi:UPF0575 protein C19orf67 homolog [Parambassis ranga]|uniref:UPF0575 protein C19orf67 homolog n=1 Tax=Parambassis ranga TaxID=210632 RepID=A0A6P7KFZ1_9TELE|nr:UPF0575 protein C19orf67 homolog [Parambassis ranga]